MGFFMDGEAAQMPIVLGVMRVKKSADTQKEKVFAFTGEAMEPRHCSQRCNSSSDEP